jgi:predicted DNA binding CopG/RHH family protein
MKLDTDEKKLLESVERGDWKSAGGGKRERTRYSRYAKATFRKDRRLNIRLSSKDLEAIQKRALAERLPYQTSQACSTSTRQDGSKRCSASSVPTVARDDSGRRRHLYLFLLGRARFDQPEFD